MNKGRVNHMYVYTYVCLVNSMELPIGCENGFTLYLIHHFISPFLCSRSKQVECERSLFFCRPLEVYQDFSSSYR